MGPSKLKDKYQAYFQKLQIRPESYNPAKNTYYKKIIKVILPGAFNKINNEKCPLSQPISN